MPSVRTAISVEKSLLDKIDETAKNLHLSRSKFFAVAAEDYLHRMETQELIDRLNEAYSDGLDDTEQSVLKGMKTVMQKQAGNEWQ